MSSMAFVILGDAVQVQFRVIQPSTKLMPILRCTLSKSRRKLELEILNT